MSEHPESPAAPGSDETAALGPDEATAVHPTGGEPSGAEPVPAVAPMPAAEPAAPPGSSVPSVLPDPAGAVTASPEPPVWTPPAAPQDGAGVSGAAAAVANDRPEVAAGAAFAGGLVLALILKRLAR